jgi:hypothetical protein
MKTGGQQCRDLEQEDFQIVTTSNARSAAQVRQPQRRRGHGATDKAGSKRPVIGAASTLTGVSRLGRVADPRSLIARLTALILTGAASSRVPHRFMRPANQRYRRGLRSDGNFVKSWGKD